jgi:hypothetical protein
MKRTSSASAIPRWHIAILTLLMAAQIACGIWTSDASSDTNRDIFFAEQIASGSYFPLSGPEINGMLHLGPLWYYILGLALWLIPNAAAVTGAMTAMSSLQFPLAYYVGRRFGSAREGLLFALALAMPGFMNMAFGSMTHPVIIVSAFLFGIVAAANYRENPDTRRAICLGVACLLMATAHPTLVTIAGFLVVWAALRTREPRDWIWHGGIVLGILLISLAPMVYEQWRHGFADIGVAEKYTQSDWSFPSLIKAVQLLFATVVNGPKYVTRFWLESTPAQAHALFAIYVLTFLAAIIGVVLRLRSERDKRLMIGTLFTLLIAQAVFLCAIRALMPPWMIHSEFVLIAALLAFGLEWFCRRGGVLRAGVAFALCVTTLWTFDAYRVLASGPLDHTELKPSPGKHGMMDIREYEKAKTHYRLARIPFRQLFAIGAPLCEPVTLFGHYAYLVDYTYAVSATAKCGTTANVQFGGELQPQRTALIGLHESVWPAIGFTPLQTIGVMGIATPIAVWHSTTPLKPVVPLLTNFPRVLVGTMQTFTVSGDAPSDQAVLVSSRAARYRSFDVVGARMNGETIAPSYSDGTAVVFLAPEHRRDGESIHWDIDITATPEYVDVVTFRSAP